MNYKLYQILILLLLITTLAKVNSAVNPPNIILIYTDDQGWNELSLKKYSVCKQEILKFKECNEANWQNVCRDKYLECSTLLGKNNQTIKAMANSNFFTPNLDKLAEEGILFTNAYANAGVCTPSRASLLTGQYAPKHGIYTVGGSYDENLLQDAPLPISPTIKKVLDKDTNTFVKILKNNGYNTALIGKWHLETITDNDKFIVDPNPKTECVTEYKIPTESSYTATIENMCVMNPMDGKIYTVSNNITVKAIPEHFGFKEVKGANASGKLCHSSVKKVHDWEGTYNGFYTLTTHPVGSISSLNKYCLGTRGIPINSSATAYMTDYLTTEHVIPFIEKNINQPFFIYMPLYAPHRPWVAKDRNVNHNTNKEIIDRYKAMIESIDYNVGKIVQKIESNKKLAENTIVIFVSDNGIHYTIKQAINKYPLSGSKGGFYEGGIRVPMIIKWPMVNLWKNKVSHIPVVVSDLYSTILDLANIKGYPDADGKSILTILNDNISNRPVYWYNPYNLKRWIPSAVIRQGDWKLMEFFHVAKNDLNRFKLYRLDDKQNEHLNIKANLYENKDTNLIINNQLDDVRCRLEKKLLNWYKTSFKSGKYNEELILSDKCR
ncbi:sulfatase-like hydrolase/transferase [Thiotrichales bacterium HSG1]|nr:sulfatase-like hydrolase/transferase [Thiotrichales bacterium HSG1]